MQEMQEMGVSGTEEPGGLQSLDLQRDMTEQLNILHTAHRHKKTQKPQEFSH